MSSLTLHITCWNQQFHIKRSHVSKYECKHTHTLGSCKFQFSLLSAHIHLSFFSHAKIHHSISVLDYKTIVTFSYSDLLLYFYVHYHACMFALGFFYSTLFLLLCVCWNFHIEPYLMLLHTIWHNVPWFPTFSLCNILHVQKSVFVYLSYNFLSLVWPFIRLLKFIPSIFILKL